MLLAIAVPSILRAVIFGGLVWTGRVKVASVATASWEYRAVVRGPSTERRQRAENDVGGFLREMQINIVPEGADSYAVSERQWRRCG